MSVRVANDAPPRCTVSEAAQTVIAQLQERCLFSSTAWLAEILLQAPSSVLELSVPVPRADPVLQGAARVQHAFASALFSKGEYVRCAELLTKTDAHKNFPQMSFLAMYALYMDAQQQAQWS